MCACVQSHVPSRMQAHTHTRSYQIHQKTNRELPITFQFSVDKESSRINMSHGHTQDAANWSLGPGGTAV